MSKSDVNSAVGVKSAVGTQMKLMEITPTIAKEWLKKNPNYRKLKPRAVARYTRIMEAGKWKVNANTIKLGDANILIDGQNRLTACINANKSFKTWVAFGVDTHEGIDEGVNRTVADELRYQGYRNYTVLAAAARFVHDFEHAALNREIQFSNLEIIETIKKHKLLEEFVAVARRRTHNLPESPIAAVLYLGSNKDLEHPLVSKFLDGLETGANLSRGNPILVLRDFWAKLTLQPYRPSHTAIRAHIVLAWNGLVQKKRKFTKKDLEWYESGPRKQDFPRLLIARR